MATAQDFLQDSSFLLIGDNCYLEHAYIGLYTSISDRGTIIDCDLEHSVILNDAKITNIHQRIIDSMIGQRVLMKHLKDLRLSVSWLEMNHSWNYLRALVL